MEMAAVNNHIILNPGGTKPKLTAYHSPFSGLNAARR